MPESGAAYRYRPVSMGDGLWVWEIRIVPAPLSAPRLSVSAAGHDFKTGDVVHIEHEAVQPGSTVLHDPSWPTERRARFRMWHNGEAVDSQVVRHASYDPAGKIKMHTVGQTLTIAPDTREGGPNQTQGVVEDARILGS